MPGQRHRMDSQGESYEAFAKSVLGRIASLTRVETKQDFGADVYCQPRVPSGAHSEAVTELCLIQIKAVLRRSNMVGSTAGETGRATSSSRIRSLWAPLYLATVDVDYRRVDIFSAWPIWWVMWQCGAPFKVVCSWREMVDAPHQFVAPSRGAEHALATESGDGRTWSVDLGPPILRLSHESLNDSVFVAKAVGVLRAWIQVDRQTVARFHANIPFVHAHHSWQTNELPVAGQILLAWDPTPGRNIEGLGKALVPSLVGLGVHLQWQDNRDAYRLIPILEWIEARGFGDAFTKGLLEGLVATERAGTGPVPSDSTCQTSRLTRRCSRRVAEGVRSYRGAVAVRLAAERRAVSRARQYERRCS